MVKIKVKSAYSAYNIFIDHDLTETIKTWLLAHNESDKVLVITDENVDKLYREKIIGLLKATHKAPFLYVIEAGEKSKNMQVAEQILTFAIKAHLERNSLILAFGGGVVSDVAGFVASIYLRGVPFVIIPTTLLAQVDASVGGKVAVNHQLGKNLIGSFYNPEAVFIDLFYLDTLPQREFVSAMAEIIKYGIIYDKKIFTFLEQNQKSILKTNTDSMIYIIKRACTIKAEIVSKDEKDRGLRKILNFGHTIAHALEICTKYKYTHGEAVAIGIHGASLLSHQLGYLEKNSLHRIQNLLRDYHLPTKSSASSIDEILSVIKRDKKSTHAKVEWVLTRGLGTYIFQEDISKEVVKKVLAEISLGKEAL